MATWTPELKALYEALKPEPEPEAHCYECPNRHGDCAEYTACSTPSYPYDRGHCRWGYESIQKLRPSKEVNE